MKKAILVVLAVAALCGVGRTWAYPKPSLVPGIGDWTLDVTFDGPRQITVTVPGEAQPRRFWYLILTLTNNSTVTDAPFYPACDLMTDTFRVIEAGVNVPRAVFAAVRLRHQSRYPFLEWLEDVDHRILQGEDNTRDVAVIWPDFDARAREVTFYIAGLSNETAAVDHPILRDDQGRPQKVLLRKTLALRFYAGGEGKLRSQATLTFKDKSWVMR
ncbi:MAG TPA: hypothetical protein ENN87_10800 [Phycisphaerales bacterium]|nr:hypothetical protein [Phycisphaerales bacterium]